MASLKASWQTGGHSVPKEFAHQSTPLPTCACVGAGEVSNAAGRHVLASHDLYDEKDWLDEDGS
eukprot:6472537-Amphidinium_carterae.1